MISRGVTRSIKRSINKSVSRYSSLDPDAAAYIAAVEAADGQALEPAVRLAYDEFIRGCKLDTFAITSGDVVAGATFRNWDRIKASCILAGARTLSGALVPLVGAAPTNNNFVAGDYSRTTGLVGDGSTKFLNTQRSNSADPQDNFHLAIYATEKGDTGYGLGLGLSESGISMLGLGVGVQRSRSSTIQTVSTSGQGFNGHSRSGASSYIHRAAGTNTTLTQSSQTSDSRNILAFARGTQSAPAALSNGRISFYSIGESLDLALLDARLATLMSSLS